MEKMRAGRKLPYPTKPVDTTQPRFLAAGVFTWQVSKARIILSVAALALQVSMVVMRMPVIAGNTR